MWMKSRWDDYQMGWADDRARQQIILRASTENNSLIELDCPVIERTVLTGALLHLLKKSLSGVCVLLAPPGSGKSTYLNQAIKKYRTLHPNRKIYFVTGLDEDYFTKSLGIPGHGAFQDFLPKKSIIIFDQMDSNDLTEAQKKFILKVATFSRNSNGSFRVFLSVSSACVAEQVLSLEGRDKIYLGVKPEMFKWNHEHLFEFAQKANVRKSRRYRRVDCDHLVQTVNVCKICPCCSVANDSDDDSDDESQNGRNWPLSNQDLHDLVNLYVPFGRCGPLFATMKSIKQGQSLGIPSATEIQGDRSYSDKLWEACRDDNGGKFGRAFYNISAPMAADMPMPRELPVGCSRNAQNQEQREEIHEHNSPIDHPHFGWPFC